MNTNISDVEAKLVVVKQLEEQSRVENIELRKAIEKKRETRQALEQAFRQFWTVKEQTLDLNNPEDYLESLEFYRNHDYPYIIETTYNDWVKSLHPQLRFFDMFTVADDYPLFAVTFTGKETEEELNLLVSKVEALMNYLILVEGESRIAVPYPHSLLGDNIYVLVLQKDEVLIVEEHYDSEPSKILNVEPNIKDAIKWVMADKTQKKEPQFS